jgi:hypothetical protein
MKNETALLSNSLLSRLQYQHETIYELVKGLIPDELKQRINPDKWSAFENIVHLVAYNPTFLNRIDIILNEERPVFDPYVADNDPHFRSCLEKPFEVLMQDLQNERAMIFNAITGLNSNQLDRKALHKKYGEMSLLKWTEFFLLHEPITFLPFLCSAVN